MGRTNNIEQPYIDDRSIFNGREFDRDYADGKIGCDFDFSIFEAEVKKPSSFFPVLMGKTFPFFRGGLSFFIVILCFGEKRRGHHE